MTSRIAQPNFTINTDKILNGMTPKLLIILNEKPTED